ncbi:MAG TPA: hypothetical protein VHP55_10160 [Usitatibacter sp.]|jgi:hypothetical protein|nr:hypothetical protein [Usitatibacter sp.]
MDDLRNHDAKPNAHEREWMATDPMPVVMRVLTLGAIALMIGVASSVLVSPPAAHPTVASNAR